MLHSRTPCPKDAPTWHWEVRKGQQGDAALYYISTTPGWQHCVYCDKSFALEPNAFSCLRHRSSHFCFVFNGTRLPTSYSTRKIKIHTGSSSAQTSAAIPSIVCNGVKPTVQRMFYIHISPFSFPLDRASRHLRLIICRTWTLPCGVRLTGPTTFRDNAAFLGGAIYYTAEFGSGFNGSGSDFPISITSFPNDTIFENNRADVRGRGVAR